MSPRLGVESQTDRGQELNSSPTLPPPLYVSSPAPTLANTLKTIPIGILHAVNIQLYVRGESDLLLLLWRPVEQGGRFGGVLRNTEEETKSERERNRGGSRTRRVQFQIYSGGGRDLAVFI